MQKSKRVTKPVNTDNQIEEEVEQSNDQTPQKPLKSFDNVENTSGREVLLKYVILSFICILGI